MRYRLVRYVGVESRWDVWYALERPDGQLERTNGPGSKVRVFEEPRAAFRYVKWESGARDIGEQYVDSSYCITWDGTTY